MLPSLFRERLAYELTLRRARNPRYSLRAFASLLRTNHSTLSQILRGLRPLPLSQLQTWAKRLNIDPEEMAYYVGAESTPDAETSRRLEHLRHWTAEAQVLISQNLHWKIVLLSRTTEFQADCRWIARQTKTTVDEVNIAFSRLLRLGLMEVRSPDRWVDLTGLPRLSEPAFRKLALERIRQKSAMFHEPVSTSISRRKNGQSRFTVPDSFQITG